MKNYRRLFKFLKGKMHWFFISLLMIIVIQALAFISPLLVKAVLDDYILGIEYEWNQVVESDEYTVKFNDLYYKQTRFLDDNDIVIKNEQQVFYHFEGGLCSHRFIGDNFHGYPFDSHERL